MLTQIHPPAFSTPQGNSNYDPDKDARYFYALLRKAAVEAEQGNSSQAAHRISDAFDEKEHHPALGQNTQMEIDNEPSWRWNMLRAGLAIAINSLNELNEKLSIPFSSERRASWVSQLNQIQKEIHTKLEIKPLLAEGLSE